MYILIMWGYKWCIIKSLLVDFVLCYHVTSFFFFLIQYKIKSIQDLVSLKGSDRRNLLHFLEDKKYDEVMAVLGSFPYVTMDIKPQGEWEVLLFCICCSSDILIAC